VRIKVLTAKGKRWLSSGMLKLVTSDENGPAVSAKSAITEGKRAERSKFFVLPLNTQQSRSVYVPKLVYITEQQKILLVTMVMNDPFCEVFF
jgi:hypothetical protein